jgi:Tripartite tricarboxylate transporter family receptor
VPAPSSPCKRCSTQPEVPTIAEALPGYEARTWAGVGAPKGTPGAVIARLDREIGAVLAEPTIEARLADLGTVLMPLNAQEFAAFIAAESEKWGKVVRIANIAPNRGTRLAARLCRTPWSWTCVLAATHGGIIAAVYSRCQSQRNLRICHEQARP